MRLQNEKLAQTPRLFLCLFILITGLQTSANAARVLDHCSLKELCAMADLVVKVEIIDSTEIKTVDGDCAVWNVKILSILKGEAEQQSLTRVTGIEEYQKGPGIKGVGKGYPPLIKGDIVYLFLVPKDASVGYAKYRLTDAKWQVIESGARLVVEDHVYDFRQYFPNDSFAEQPRGFIAATKLTFPQAEVVSVQAFEKQIREFLHPLSGKTPDP